MELDCIEKILIIDKCKRIIIGLCIGLVIDVIVALVIIKSSFDTPLSVSF